MFTDLSLTVFYQDHLCIMGENGSGKTTLLQIILDELPSDQGTVSLGSNVKIGYLPQNMVFKDDEMTLLEYFMDLHLVTEGEARSELAKLLFVKDDVYKKICNLSGGEKSRLKLCSLFYENVNLLILDEPTNHLDIDSREILEEILIHFKGTILFVSHDRYFIQKIANKIMVLENCKGKLYPMPYKDYLEEKQKEMMEIPTKMDFKKPKKDQTKTIKKPINEYKLTKAENELEMLEEKLKFVEEQMILYSVDAEKLFELYKEKKLLENKYEETFIHWEKLQKGIVGKYQI